MRQVEYVVVSSPLYGRAFSEDVSVVVQRESDCQFFAAVVDGHGQERGKDGKKLGESRCVSEFAQTVTLLLVNGFCETFNADGFPNLFLETDRELRTRFGSRENLEVGAVASCVALSGSELVCAQAGDCRLYRAFGGPQSFMLMTQDHNAHRPLEVRRLNPLMRGSRIKVLDLDTPVGFPQTRLRLYQTRGGNLYGGLRPTRGFGNWDYRPVFTSEPEVRKFDLAKMPPGTLFALCTDGASMVVENVMRSTRGRTSQLVMEELKALTSSRLSHPDDDATVVYFRVLD